VGVQWLIEVDVFPDTAKRICGELDRVGLRWTRYHDEVRGVELPSKDLPVIFWGSLGAAYTDCVAANWTPGAIGDVGRFACRAYYEGIAGIPFANSDAIFTTVADLVADPASNLASLGTQERVFIRPDSPLKPFSGRELSVSEISLSALDHGFYYEDDQLPIVVSTPKRVEREWRFVVGDGAVVAGCEYVESREGVGTDVPDGAQALAARVAEAEWQAAPLYVVDVGEVDGDYRVMELNPFSGADLYHCDPAAVVATGTRIAQRLFDEVPANG
jgi:hypothetical protein